MCIRHNGDLYSPIILHLTISQDRPVGDVLTFREHRHNLYHLVLYTAGHGSCLVDTQVHEARPGTMIIVSPGQSHDFITRFGNAVYSELTFAFENEHQQPLVMPFQTLLGQLTAADIRLPHPIHLSESETHLFNTLLTDMIDLVSLEHTLSEFYLQYALLKLFHFMLQTSVPPASSEAIADQRLIRVRQYIEQNYNTPLTIEELAGLAQLSKGYLFRAFGKAFGITPLAYQKQLRLEAARTLLRSSALRCSEIAVRCGYENIHFFHRTFKQTFGITPNQYRKALIPPKPGVSD